MNIVVFSDSHGDTRRMIDIINSIKDIGLIIHLGDVARDAEKLECIFTNCKVEYVAGNNDWFTELPQEKIVDVGGKRIFITHGNFYRVKNGYGEVVHRGKSLDTDIILFGHTHIPYESWEGNTLVLNPGSITQPASGSAYTYGVIEIVGERITAKIHKYLPNANLS